MKKIYSFLLSALVYTCVYAQQDPMYSQYWINASILNPAQASADGNTVLNLTGRYQWVNVNGAPRTGSLSFGGMPYNNLGFSGSYVFDQVGPLRSNTVNGDVAYHLRVSEKWTASLGTRISATMLNVNLTSLYTDQQNDPAFAQNLNSGVKPNVGFGILVHNDKFYFGFAQPRVVDYDLSSTVNMSSRIVAHRFAYAGYNQKVNDQLELRPSMLFKHVNQAPLQVDLNVVAEFAKKISAGISYRSGDGIGIMLGSGHVENLRVYYCFDYPLSAISVITKQTHQLSLVYTFTRKPTYTTSPRYFE